MNNIAAENWIPVSSGRLPDPLVEVLVVWLYFGHPAQAVAYRSAYPGHAWTMAYAKFTPEVTQWKPLGPLPNI